VGLSSYQTTLSVLAKGDLETQYGVDWRSIVWVTATEEPMPFELPAGVRLERLPAGARLDALLLDGAIAAIAHPQPPRAIQDGDPRVRRLFADAPAEERAYFRRNGYWPAMHAMVFKEAILREHPWVAQAFMDAFARAREIAYRYYDDPNWSRLAWGRHYFEEELALFGGDPWRDGFAANRPYLSRFLTYARDQGLIGPDLTPEQLFVESTRDR
jgi:4,5-dihydroxyphthalate decarboxylase